MRGPVKMSEVLEDIRLAWNDDGLLTLRAAVEVEIKKRAAEKAKKEPRATEAETVVVLIRNLLRGSTHWSVNCVNGIEDVKPDHPRWDPHFRVKELTGRTTVTLVCDAKGGES